MPLEELCHLIEVSSHKRFRMPKARELQELARNSFGFGMAGDVFSTMIRLYTKHLDFLKQQVREGLWGLVKRKPGELLKRCLYRYAASTAYGSNWRRKTAAVVRP